MVNINHEFPSKYLKSSDLNGQMVRVQIGNVTSEQIGNESKLIMYFAGKTKGMVLNKTNAKTLAEQFGDETDNWVGAQIEVFSMKVDYQGRMVDGLRVRVPPQPKVARTNGAPPIKTGGATFVANARDDDRMRRGLPDNRLDAPPPPQVDEDLNDEIPF